MAQRIIEVEYMIEQKILSNLWQDNDNFSALIYFVKENQKEAFVGWYNKVAHHFDEESIEYTIDDFDFMNKKIDNVEFFIIKMPEPLEEGMAYYVILTFDFNIKKRIYFLVEKGNEMQDYFLCSVAGEKHAVHALDEKTEIGQLVSELMSQKVDA